MPKKSSDIAFPELLAPAGNLEKLKVAVLYGADAVYLSGQRFGLRAGADNFTLADMTRGVAFAHERNVKVYVTINSFFHDEDFVGLLDYCRFLESLAVKGVIVSDLGVISEIKAKTSLEVHVSTQRSCLNTEDALFLKELGASRIVLGRELSIKQARALKASAGIEVEMFIHGAMCMAYSGHCVISNYTAGRDSNRGGCVQSCRYKYTQIPKRGLELFPDSAQTSHFISSKDMSAEDQLELLVAAGIDSLKIEGRMKSALYVATTTSAYRQALDSIKRGEFSPRQKEQLGEELRSIPHRDYIPGFFLEEPQASTYGDDYGTKSNSLYTYAGVLVDSSSSMLGIRAHSTLEDGACLEFLTFDGKKVPVSAKALYDVSGSRIARTKPGEVFCLPQVETSEKLAPFTIIRQSANAL